MVHIVYGLPTSELGEKAERGEIVLGGCCVSGDDSEWFCRDCGWAWNARRGEQWEIKVGWYSVQPARPDSSGASRPRNETSLSWAYRLRLPPVSERFEVGEVFRPARGSLVADELPSADERDIERAL